MKKKWVVCSGTDWYRPLVSSTEQLMKQFYVDGYNVLWVNPIAFRYPFSESITSRSAWIKIRDKIRTHLRFILRVRKGFWVWVPIYIPVFNNVFNKLNRWLIQMQFAFLTLILSIHRKTSILWCTPSTSALHLLKYNFKVKIYEAHDLMSDFRTDSKALRMQLLDKERLLCKQSNIILAATENIKRKIQGLAPQKSIHLLLHAVDFNHFSEENELSKGIEQIKRAGRPIAGYFGSLSDANDKIIFKVLAEGGFSVVLIGRLLGDYTELEKNPNVYLVGSVKYEILPSWAHGFDVALLNWRMHEWIDNCFPVKSLEYLAVGLPVVSCPIPVLQKHYSDVISFAESPDEFLEKCLKAVENDSDSERKRRKDSVRDYSWENAYAYVKELISETGTSTY